MRVRGLILLFLTGLFGASSALADIVAVTLRGVNGAAAFCCDVGPYYGTLDGKPETLYRVDLMGVGADGQQWFGNFISLNDVNRRNTLHGGMSNAQDLYRQAAWLTTQFAQHPDAYADIQATIWQLFNPSAPVPSSSLWRELAAVNSQNIDPQQFVIVTNLGPWSRTEQVGEFLVAPLSPVPEPSSIVLLGMGILLVVFFLARRRSVSIWVPSAASSKRSRRDAHPTRQL
jgi:hypothetical protein